MLFNSFVFIFLFLPLVYLGFAILGRFQRIEAAIAWLVISSLFFYGWWNPVYLLFIIGSILVNYLIGSRLASQPDRSHRKWLLGIGVALNLGFLGYFKYLNFLVDTVNWPSGTGWSVDEIALPLAISFFTFQQIAFLADAAHGETQEYNFLHYCLFVTFFPQLISGPIVHHREMMPQFMQAETFKPRYANLSVGLTIFLLGLFKKVVLADGIAEYSSPVFDAAGQGQISVSSRVGVVHLATRFSSISISPDTRIWQ